MIGHFAMDEWLPFHGLYYQHLLAVWHIKVVFCFALATSERFLEEAFITI